MSDENNDDLHERDVFDEEDWHEEDWHEEDWHEEDWHEEDWHEEDWHEEDWHEDIWTDGNMGRNVETGSGLEEELDTDSDISNSDGPTEENIIIDGEADIVDIDMKNISLEEVRRYDFRDLETAFLFYSVYARVNGFAPRKHNFVRNKAMEIVQQTFVCSREGHQANRGVQEENRKRIEKRARRCDCYAKFRVHINFQTRRWYVTVFYDQHTHVLMPEKYGTLIPGNRQLSQGDKVQIQNLRSVGVRPPHIYGVLAKNAGGYENSGFIMKDIYNEIGRQRKGEVTDANGAVKFLRQMKSDDPLMYVKHMVDDEGRLQRLFWSDAEGQMNYRIFGDVLAFDATYKKNRRRCPVVIFSGINNHNQTTVFATGIVTNETEETYVWLLQEFLNVMLLKPPVSVITDGDLAMKNAIKKVFPEAHHRLCAWHLLRNATSNIGNPEMMSHLKSCMFGEYGVDEWEEKWNELITTFNLEDNKWMKEMYAKKHKWATTHIRGKFFAGIRTTSRCEALHSHMGKYVHSKIRLTDFVQQYQRCVTYFRFREVYADFESEYREFKPQTQLIIFEKSGYRQYSWEIFCLYRQVLLKASTIDVLECLELPMYSIFSTKKYRGSGTLWKVSYVQSPMEFRCDCLRMESTGIPCEHIIAVLRYLQLGELPGCLVLQRWSRKAKDSISGMYPDGSFYWESHSVAKYAHMVNLCKQLSTLASRDDEDYHGIVEYVTTKIKELESKQTGDDVVDEAENADPLNNVVLNPPTITTKGGSTPKGKRQRQKCSICGNMTHNRRRCPKRRAAEQTFDNSDEPRTNFAADDDEDLEHEFDGFSQIWGDEPESSVPFCGNMSEDV